MVLKPVLLQELERRREVKRQRRDVGMLRHMQAQLQGEASEQAARLARRLARQAEKTLLFPPKLGKQKFQPLPTQVRRHCFQRLKIEV